MRRVLDTSELVSNWLRCRARARELPSSNLARDWARELCKLHETDAIVTPVYVEFIAGAQSGAELDAYRAYLSGFRVIDDGRVLEGDWAYAKRLAGRVPSDGKPRQLGDCLIAALAFRLNCAVQTQDRYFPK
jgi:predicted nucleic acid-binding protein